MQTIRCSALLDLVERIRPPTHCITPEPYLKEMQFFHREMFKPYIVRLFFFLISICLPNLTRTAGFGSLPLAGFQLGTAFRIQDPAG